jgi:hypothetical protein
MVTRDDFGRDLREQVPRGTRKSAGVRYDCHTASHSAVGSAFPRHEFLARLVTRLYEKFSAFDVLGAVDRNFQIAGPEVPDLCHVAGEARLKGYTAGVCLQKDDELFRLRMNLDAREFLILRKA